MQAKMDVWSDKDGTRKLVYASMVGEALVRWDKAKFDQDPRSLCSSDIGEERDIVTVAVGQAGARDRVGLICYS